MSSIKELEREIREIKKRNDRVEADKAWETSKTRKSIIALFTYLSIALYLQSIDLPSPWLNAIVPTIGFLLSTLTFPYFKRIWAVRALKE